MTTIQVIKCTWALELCRRYEGRGETQTAYIELDLSEGTLLADYDSQIDGSAPSAVRTGFERRYRIPVLTAVAVNRLLAKLAPLADRILADWEKSWNGETHVAVLGADAKSAEKGMDVVLEAGFDAPDIVGEWDADDVTNGSEADEYDIVAGTTDERLTEIAAEITEGMIGSSDHTVGVIHELDAYLRRVRAEADAE
ncbi:hypothetical protein [Streptomyces paludis]|uniref:Uncharacterized protein n=1 Tax=Streptomyces paludis TaxID=2282738 RepID=A0A345HWT9_9ACTN|nr:hypothetical protein [Streptomyces paludis]AXG81163.1 hypothetical protein DVK44_29625 [Streptomyces paludis]